MHNVHEDHPVVFQTRWALSYLRGPLTRTEVETLMAPRRFSRADAAGAPDQTPVRSTPASPPAEETSAEPPVVPAAIEQVFAPCTRPTVPEGRRIYRPRLLAEARLHYVRAAADIDAWDDVAVVAPFPERVGPVDWEAARFLGGRVTGLEREPQPGVAFAGPPAVALHADHYEDWRKALASFLYRHQTVTLYRCEPLKLHSRRGETEGEFRGRIRHVMHEQRDQGIERLRRRFAGKLAAVQDRIRRAEDRLERERAQLEQLRLDTAVSVGATVLGALFGRKLASQRNLTRAGSAVRGVGRASKEQLDVEAAADELEAQRRTLRELEQSFEQAVDALEQDLDPDTVELTAILLRPRKADIAVERCGILWTPWGTMEDGAEEPLVDLA